MFFEVKQFILDNQVYEPFTTDSNCRVTIFKKCPIIEKPELDCDVQKCSTALMSKKVELVANFRSAIPT